MLKIGTWFETERYIKIIVLKYWGIYGSFENLINMMDPTYMNILRRSVDALKFAFGALKIYEYYLMIS